MIKKLLFVTLTIAAINFSAQNFSGMYPFTGVTTGSANTGTVDPTPPPTAPGLAFGSFSAVGTPTATSAGGVFAFSGWGAGATNGNDTSFTGALDPGKYYEVTLTPTSGSSVTINSITFNAARSSTGPRFWSVRGSGDSFYLGLPVSISPSNTNIAAYNSSSQGGIFFWSLDSYTVSGKQEKGSTVSPGILYNNQTSPMSFRFYAWNAETTVGIFRIDTVIFNGSASIISGINTLTHDLNSKFKLYPNPSNDGIVYLEASSVSVSKVEIINILGASVVSNNNITENKIKLDVNSLSVGTYFVRIHSASGITTEKLIISK